MNRINIVLLLVLLVMSCGNKHLMKEARPSIKTISAVDIDVLIEDSTLNVRALEVIKKKDGFAFLTSKGQFGTFVMPDVTINIKKDYIKNFPIQLKHDSILPNFRALAVNKKTAYGISIGNPTLVYSLDVDKEKIKLVYTEVNEKAFYDSIEFWNEEEGIAIGDPTEDCMSIIVTRDGGNSWSKLSCDVLPKAKDGEAAFAASDTNIAIVGDKTWVATGGKTSRILYSPDKGHSWQVFETPIIQGIETTGMYSVDFYDELNGYAIGGDYTKPEANAANKIKTKDGGKTWELVAQNQNPGYRSCVKYVPNSGGKALVAIGYKGIDYSNDSGNTWKHLSDDGYYTIRFLNDSIAFAAGNKKISKLTFK